MTASSLIKSAAFYALVAIIVIVAVFPSTTQSDKLQNRDGTV